MAGLSAHIESVFTLEGTHPGEYHFRGRKIDFRTCELQEAEDMFALGFPGLKKVEAKTSENNPEDLEDINGKSSKKKK